MLLPVTGGMWGVSSFPCCGRKKYILKLFAPDWPQSPALPQCHSRGATAARGLTKVTLRKTWGLLFASLISETERKDSKALKEHLHSQLPMEAAVPTSVLRGNVCRSAAGAAMSGERLPPAGTSSRKAPKSTGGELVGCESHSGQSRGKAALSVVLLGRCLQCCLGSCDTAECRYRYYLIALLCNSCKSIEKAHLGCAGCCTNLELLLPLQSIQRELQDST